MIPRQGGKLLLPKLSACDLSGRSTNIVPVNSGSPSYSAIVEKIPESNLKTSRDTATGDILVEVYGHNYPIDATFSFDEEHDSLLQNSEQHGPKQENMLKTIGRPISNIKSTPISSSMTSSRGETYTRDCDTYHEFIKNQGTQIKDQCSEKDTDLNLVPTKQNRTATFPHNSPCVIITSSVQQSLVPQSSMVDVLHGNNSYNSIWTDFYNNPSSKTNLSIPTGSVITDHNRDTATANTSRTSIFLCESSNPMPISSFAPTISIPIITPSSQTFPTPFMNVMPLPRISDQSLGADHQPFHQLQLKKCQQSKLKKTCRLWEFIRNLLLDPETNPSIICWEDRSEGLFRLVQPRLIAYMWGSKKGNKDMTYEKLSRAMRYYYKRKIFEPVFNKRLVYKFGTKAVGWKEEDI